jgi:hypothetical protein
MQSLEIEIELDYIVGSCFPYMLTFCCFLSNLVLDYIINIEENMVFL